MARHFDGTNHLWIAGGITLPCSVFFWAKTASTSLTSAFYSGYYTYTFDGLVSKTQARARYWSGGGLNTGRQWDSTTSFPVTGDDEWHQVVLLFQNVTTGRVYVDGNYQGDLVGGTNENVLPQHTVLGAAYHSGPGTASAHFTGDLADVCLWSNYLLTEIEIASLKNDYIRPNQIATNSVYGYWPLPETGELNNVTGALGTWSNVNNVTVSPDPPYTPPPTTTAFTRPAYAPRAFSRLLAPTAPDAPSRDKLLSWYPGVRPFTDYWNNREGNTSIIAAGNTELREGQDNSSHNEYGDSGRIILPSYNSGSWVPGITYSFWIRVYDFNKHNILYWNGSVMFYGSQADAGASTLLGYHTLSTNPYGYYGQLQFTRLNYYTPASYTSSPLPLDEWVHYSVNVDITNNVITYYRNGRFDTTIGATLRPDIAYLPTIQSYIHNSSAFGYGFGTYDLKDFRVYNGPLSSDEVQWIYSHSREFLDGTSGIINTDVRPIRAEQKIEQLAKVETLARVAGVALSPGAISRSIGAARLTAFSRGVIITPGTTIRTIGKALAPARAKGIAPQGGLISQSLAKVAGLAHAKGVYFMLPPVLTAWAKAIAPGFAKGLTAVGGLAVGNVGRAPAPARSKGILPQGGLISQAFARVMGFARVFGVTGLTRDFSFHGSLTRMLATSPWASIERERRTLLGADSKLELLSISGHEWILEMELSSHWVARRARFLGTSDEWLLEIPEDKIGKFPAVQDLAGARIYTHGQTLTFRITQANRPLKAGHLWEFQLEAIGDKD